MSIEGISETCGSIGVKSLLSSCHMMLDDISTPAIKAKNEELEAAYKAMRKRWWKDLVRSSREIVAEADSRKRPVAS